MLQKVRQSSILQYLWGENVMHYIFGGKCTAILSNAVQFSKCTATCNALHSTSLVQYSGIHTFSLKKVFFKKS